MPHLFDVPPPIRPLVEGSYKGGRNTLPSQIVERPPAPAPIVRKVIDNNGIYLPLRKPVDLPCDVEH